MDLELSEKRAIVTGGSRGIGKAIATELAREGASVAIAARDPGRLKQTADELSQMFDREVVALPVDTGDGESVRAMVARAADALGGVDILVNAAARPGGLAPAPKFAEVSDEYFFEDMNVKVLGYLRCAREAAPHMMKNKWGRIINISGLAARSSGNVVGSIRNVAVASLTKNLADELGPHGINVSVVHPGTTRTEATTPELAERAGAANLIGRIVDAKEVAYVVTFLASPKAVAVNGDAVVVGGGSPRVIYY